MASPRNQKTTRSAANLSNIGRAHAPTVPVRTISADGNKVNIVDTSTAGDKIVILFCNRQGQKFILPNGHMVMLAGNAIDLMGAQRGALPYGGYSVNIVNKADWEEVKRLYGKAYQAWFDNGKIIEQRSEKAALNRATQGADDDPGNNPVEPDKLQTETASPED